MPRLLLPALLVLAACSIARAARGGRPMRARASLFGAALALAAGAAPAPSAQPDLPPIAWERVGDLQAGRDLLFSRGPTGDTLLAVGNGGEFGNLGIYRYAPGDAAWSDDLHTLTGTPEVLTRLPSGTIIGGAPAGPTKIDRSTDGGGHVGACARRARLRPLRTAFQWRRPRGRFPAVRRRLRLVGRRADLDRARAHPRRRAERGERAHRAPLGRPRRRAAPGGGGAERARVWGTSV